MVSAFGEEAVQNWAKLNAFKYLWRAERKGGHEDLQKAIFYLKWASGEDPRSEQSLPVERPCHPSVWQGVGTSTTDDVPSTEC